MATNVIETKELLSFCTNLQESIKALADGSADNSEKDVILNVYLEKCSRICKDIEDQIPKGVSTKNLCKYLQTITQLILDLTYVDECSLVDEDFPKPSAYTQVLHIIDTLHSVEDLTKRTVQDKSVLEVLGPEILECLSWRKGALLYMYCHSLNAQCSSEDIPEHYLKCLEEGVQFLTAMLSTRSSPEWLRKLSLDGSSEENNSHTGDSTSNGIHQLLLEGILSDTHLLALMYCGEMCYWHTKAKQNWASKSSQQLNQCQDTADITSVGVSSGACSNSKIDILSIGQSSLQTYVSVAKGPMEVGGWNTDRAEEILQYLKTLKR